MSKSNCAICGKPTENYWINPAYDPNTPFSVGSVVMCKACARREDKQRHEAMSNIVTTCFLCKGTGKIKGYRCCFCKESRKG